MFGSRDPDLQFISSYKNRYVSGMGIGVILLDDIYPGFPGDIRNPSAYPFPIQYEVCQGVDIKKLVVDPDKTLLLEPILQAARNLEKLGCRAIVAECGYFAYFQRELAASVSIPVFASSLLQVSFAQQVIAPDQVVGILVANALFLTDHHLVSVGIKLGTNYVISGAMDDGICEEFEHLWDNGRRTSPPSAFYDKAEKEFLEVAVRFYRQHTNMGAMILECTGFQPFARALQREIHIPVFSWGTLLEYANAVSAHRDYYGYA